MLFDTKKLEELALKLGPAQYLPCKAAHTRNKELQPYPKGCKDTVT